MIFKKKVIGVSRKQDIPLETVDSEFKLLVANIQIAFPTELRMIAVFGSFIRGDFNVITSDINILMVIDKLDIENLKKINSIFDKSKIHRLLSPIILRHEELPHFAESFSIKVLEIKSCYKIFAGEDLLKNLSIEKKYLRLRCEQELRNILSRMRRIITLGAPYKDLLAVNFSRFLSYYLSTLKACAYLFNVETKDQNVVSCILDLLKIDSTTMDKLIEIKKKRQRGLSLSEIEFACSGFLEVLEKSITAVDSITER